jgi:hypothetical protein
MGEGSPRGTGFKAEMIPCGRDATPELYIGAHTRKPMYAPPANAPPRAHALLIKAARLRRIEGRLANSNPARVAGPDSAKAAAVG